MMGYAYDLSEELKLPILMRVVTRMAHSRAVVKTASVREPERDKQQRRSVQFHFIAGKRPPTLCRIGKPANTARKLIGRVSL